MTATQSLMMMPRIAQTLVDQRPVSTTLTNHRVVNGTIGTRPIASTSPSLGELKRKESTTKGANDILSLSDAQLAERFQFILEIGYGNWGSVWKCKSRTETIWEDNVAIKLVHRSRSPTSSARVRSLWTEFKCIRALRGDSHPSLINFFSFIITPSYALIVMALHPRPIPVELPESKTRLYGRQLVSAVEFLHAHGCSHNDIKPANILLSETDVPVLVDFGFSQTYPHEAKDRFISSLSWGTPEYLSPERARGVPHDERLSDIFALGCCLYEIRVGRTPFEKSESEEFLTREALEIYYHRTTMGAFCGESDISPEFATLIHAMIEPQVNLRLQSCGAALDFPFFNATSVAPRHSFLDSPSQMRLPHSPIRNDSLTRTPASSGKKNPAGYRKPLKLVKTDDNSKPIKVFRDTPTRQSPARPTSQHTSTTTTPSTPHHARAILTERKDLTNVASPSNHSNFTSPASKIPIRKSELYSPSRSQNQTIASTPLKNPARSRTTSFATPQRPTEILPPSQPPTTTKRYSPVIEKVKEATRNRILSSSPTKTEFKISTPVGLKKRDAYSPRGNDHQEVLESARNGSPATPVHAHFGSTLSPITFDTVGSTEDLTFTSFGRTSPVAGAPDLPRSKSQKGLSFRLRKLSLRRAPSAMSFRGLKSSISNVTRRRASTGVSISDDIVTLRSEDHAAVTMPINVGGSVKQSRRWIDEAERTKFESFSRHIQHIIDTRKPDEPTTFTKRTTVILDDSTKVERPILSFADVKKFSQQVNQELETNRKISAAPREFALPRPARSSSLSKGLSSAPLLVDRPRHPIRASLAPSFVGASPPKATPPKAPSTSTAVVRSPSSSLTSTCSNASSSLDLEAFRPGHRRIPTPLRSVPSIMLTESSGDEDDSEWSAPENSVERLVTPPPTPQLVEEARQLPAWIPNDGDSEDDGDVDEPTVTISTAHALHMHSKRPATSEKQSLTPVPSQSGLYQQFVSRTPGVDRPGRISPQFHQNDFSESRPVSRATEHSTLSRSKSVISFLFQNRAASSSSTNSTMSGSSVCDTDHEDAPRRGGRIRRAFKKLLF